MTHPSTLEARIPNARPLLLALLSGGQFAVIGSSFMIVGLLVLIGADFALSASQSSLLVAVLGIAYVVAALGVAPLLAALRYRTVLALALGISAAGSLASAASTGFVALLMARVLVSFGAGLYAPVAVELALKVNNNPATHGRAIAIVFAGATLAQVFGLPAGVWLGYYFGWRSAFLVIAAVTALIAASLVASAPGKLRGARMTLTEFGQFMQVKPIVVGILLAVPINAATNAMFTPITLILGTTTTTDANYISISLALAGIGAFVGVSCLTRLLDRLNPSMVLGAMLLIQIPLYCTITLRNHGLIEGLALMFAYGAFCYIHMPVLQARLIRLTHSNLQTVFAFLAGFNYIGLAIGSALSGIAIDTAGVGAVGVLAAGASILALLTLGIAELPAWRRRTA